MLHHIFFILFSSPTLTHTHTDMHARTHAHTFYQLENEVKHGEGEDRNLINFRWSTAKLTEITQMFLMNIWTMAQICWWRKKELSCFFRPFFLPEKKPDGLIITLLSFSAFLSSFMQLILKWNEMYSFSGVCVCVYFLTWPYQRWCQNNIKW